MAYEEINKMFLNHFINKGNIIFYCNIFELQIIDKIN